VLAWLQTSIKRLMAYSSIAHSGYMLVGVIAGPGSRGGDGGGFAQSGVSAVLFYLLVYGIANMGAFAVVACLERRREGGRDGGRAGGREEGTVEEADACDDIAGLCRTRPLLGWTMVLSAAGLLGLPPLLGFIGKLPLFTSGIAARENTHDVILRINTAIAAAYNLRLIKGPLLDEPVETPNRAPITDTPFGARRVAGLLSAIGVVALAVVAGPVTRVVWGASRYVPGDGVGRAADAIEQLESPASEPGPSRDLDATAARGVFAPSPAHAHSAWPPEPGAGG
jgi:NADH-quinone oxidoreductase subunit N